MVTTGSRPMNSGINPKLIRSSGMTSAKISTTTVKIKVPAATAGVRFLDIPSKARWDLAIGLGYQYVRLVDQRPRNGDPLALTPRKRDAPLAHQGPVALGQGGDEVDDDARQLLALVLLEKMARVADRRVGLARRALAVDPVLVLADEPTGNLDSKTSEEIMNVFEELHSSGQTIIMVTHEHDIVEHAERVVTLRDGLIESHDARADGLL